MRCAIASLVFLLVSTAICQTPNKTGAATASGTCNIANSGNGNKILLNCGIGRERAKKIVELLNKILANKDDATINAKLDELLKNASQVTQSQNNSGGLNTQQYSSGPNSPNITGNGNQVSYSDTSQIPVLSRAKVDALIARMKGTKYKLLIRYQMSDTDAGLLANDLINALNAAGWDAELTATMGAPYQLNVPIAMAVADPNSTEAVALLNAVSDTLGIEIPGQIESNVPAGEVVMVIVSRPIRRPK